MTSADVDTRPPRSSTTGPGRSQTWRHLPALLVCIGCLAPFVFTVTGSLREPGPPPRTPELLPRPLTFSNYGDAFELVDLPHQIVNSVIVAVIAVPLGVVVASWAGFALLRLPRRPRRLFAGITIAAAMVPLVAVLVGRFTVFRSLGLTNTLVPLIAPALLGESPLHVLLFFWAFRRIPPQLLDAARIEGLGELGVWRRVAMPLVRPITLAIAVSAFVDVWGSYLEPLVYLSDPDRFTVPMGIALLSQLDPTNHPLLLAGAVTAMAPVIGAFLLVQRDFLSEAHP